MTEKKWIVYDGRDGDVVTLDGVRFVKDEPKAVRLPLAEKALSAPRGTFKPAADPNAQEPPKSEKEKVVKEADNG